MTTIWLTFLGTAAAILSSIYGSRIQAQVGAASSICAGALGIALELARPGAELLWRHPRMLRLSAALGGCATGMLLLAWPGPPQLRVQQIAWTGVGFAACWVMCVFLNIGYAAKGFPPGGRSDPDRAPITVNRSQARSPLSFSDRVALWLLPVALALYLSRASEVYVWFSPLVCLFAVVGGVTMIVNALRRPRGQRLAKPRSGMLWVGLLWLWAGQGYVSDGERTMNDKLLALGWLVIGASTCVIVWVWRALPLLSGIREAATREQDKDLPVP